MADEKTEETTGFTAVETKVILSMLKNLKGDIAVQKQISLRSINPIC